MKVHKIEIIATNPNHDFDYGELEIVLENAAKDWILHFSRVETIDDGEEWDDEHPLNFSANKAREWWEKETAPNQNHS